MNVGIPFAGPSVMPRCHVFARSGRRSGCGVKTASEIHVLGELGVAVWAKV